MAGKSKQEKKLKKRIEAIKRRKASNTNDFSELLLKFFRPLLMEAPHLNGEDNAVGLGIFAWNASFLSKERWMQGLANSLAQFNLSADTHNTLQEIVEEMIRQKKLMYPNDMRVITNYDVSVDGPRIDLTVDYKLAKKSLVPQMSDVQSDSLQ